MNHWAIIPTRASRHRWMRSGNWADESVVAVVGNEWGWGMRVGVWVVNCPMCWHDSDRSSSANGEGAVKRAVVVAAVAVAAEGVEDVEGVEAGQ